MELPDFFFNFDYKDEELLHLKGRVKYYKSKEREVWFNEYKNITKEYRFFENLLRYFYIAKFDDQVLRQSNSIHYNENLDVDQENHFNRTYNVEINRDIINLDYFNKHKIEFLTNREIFFDILIERYFEKNIQKDFGEFITKQEIKYFDLYGNLLQVERSNPYFLKHYIKINNLFFIYIEYDGDYLYLKLEYKDLVKNRRNFISSEGTSDFKFNYLENFEINNKKISIYNIYESFENVNILKINGVTFFFNIDGLFVKSTALANSTTKIRKIEYCKQGEKIKSLSSINDFKNLNTIIQKDFSKNRFISIKKELINKKNFPAKFVESVTIKTLDGILISECEIISNRVIKEIFYLADGSNDVYIQSKLQPKDTIEKDEKGNLISITKYDENGKNYYKMENDECGNVILKEFYLNDKHLETEYFDLQYFD